MPFVVTHPHGAAVATGVARALDRHGLLAAFATGVGGEDGTVAAALLRRGARLSAELENRVHARLRHGRLVAHWPVELGARAFGRTLQRLGAGDHWVYDSMFVAHDVAVALSRWPARVEGVYGYEDGSLATFRRAARSGARRVWDLPIPHHATLREMWRAELTRWPDATEGRAPGREPAWKIARKDAELALATEVSVASAFTRDSLPGAVRAPVLVVPYGFPCEAFTPGCRSTGDQLRVLAVGSHDLRKGTPYLLEAWRRAGLRNARLRLVGRMRLSARFLSRYEGLFEHVAHVPRTLLAGEYRNADLLAFPTLCDGFGLVIQEAMCCGTPVATTRCGGGPECISHGVDGWILPERDVDAWVEFLRWAESHRDELVRAGVSARERAERYTWDDAGDLLVQELRRSGQV